MKTFAVVVAGGSGNRMKSEIPKQFLELRNKPILMHTLNAFARFDPNMELVLVLPREQFDYWQELCQKHAFHIQHQVVAGGSNRFESVKNGLNTINQEGIVFIHDGVRPLVAKSTLQNCLKTATAKGNALPVVPVTESIRLIDNETTQALDRSKYFLVQTPQTFRVSLIKKAYQQEYSELFTDDASVFENAGHQIFTVPGNRENIKITYPEDLLVAGLFL